jgi:hypothetical protein
VLLDFSFSRTSSSDRPYIFQVGFVHPADYSAYHVTIKNSGLFISSPLPQKELTCFVDILSGKDRTEIFSPSGMRMLGCHYHYHFIFFKRSFRVIALRFLVAFAKRFFLRIIFSFPCTFIRTLHLHRF